MAVKQYLRLSRRLPLHILAWVGGLWLFGVLLVLVINTFINDEANYACMGAMFGLAGVLPGVLLRGNLSGAVRFRLAVVMGQIRRSFLLWDTAINLAAVAMGIIFSWVLWQGEAALYALLYPGYSNDIPVELVYRWQVLAPMAVILPLVCLFFSAVILRFGTKGFGVLWIVVWGSFMLIPASLSSASEGGTSLLAKLGNGILWLAGILPPLAWAGVGAALVIAMTTAGVLFLRQAEVRL